MANLNQVKHKELIVDVLTKAGLSNKQAITASTVMAHADFKGIDSHGLILLKTYVERIKSGIINKRTSYKWGIENNNIALLDGDLGIGHFIGDIAMERAIQMAKENTIG